MTLIELLAVTLLLGGSCVIGATALSRTLRHDPVLTFHQRLPDLWSRCRDLARTHGGGELELSSHRLFFRGRRGEQQEFLVPMDLALAWLGEDGKSSIRSVSFDSSGQSVDVRLRLTSQAQTYHCLISGLTGAISRLNQ